MIKKINLVTIFFLFVTSSFAQIIQPKDTLEFVYDTFFLAKKKGWLGDLGRSISADPPKPELTQTGTVKVNLPFNKYKDYIINKIVFVRLGFNQDINDTTPKARNFGVRIAEAIHKKTKEKFIKANLFFKEGDKIVPYLIADNERYLRTLIFFEDAKIVIQPTTLSNSTDVYVYVKDNFSIGVGGNINGTNNFDVELKEENFMGNAQKISAKMLYDDGRNPKTGFGAEFIQRNLWGSFANLSLGYKTFNRAFNTGQPEENYLYAKLDRQLVSPYMPFIGSAEFAVHSIDNRYNIKDSVFKQNIKYNFVNFDAWAGYNLGTSKLLANNQQSRIRKFIGLRVFNKSFNDLPNRFSTNPVALSYINTTGVLGAVYLFKQNFYKTKYVYGFGRNEDVPEGFSFSFIGGWTNLQNVSRPYYGLDFARNYFSKAGNYFNYTFRLGGFIHDSRFDDITMLLNLEYFSKLRNIGGKKYIRKFLSFGITHQIRPTVLTPRLILNSLFGLPEFSNDGTSYQTRIVGKSETVLFNNFKLVGFKFAPFVFLNAGYFIQPGDIAVKGDIFTSVGGGIRMRNEALIFGTMEVRFNFFPKTTQGMNHYRLDFKTDLRFTYNSTFIRQPDFVGVN